MTDWQAFETRLERVLAVDRSRLRGLLGRCRKAERDGKPFDRNLVRLEEGLRAAQALYERRLSSRPAVSYPDDLPIAERRAEIAELIREHPTVVVCGETGSGKSTQLPKIAMEAGRGACGLIGHTQPRRIAARSVAARVAEELGTPLGKNVGYKIRFTDVTSPDATVKVMTDGVLLAELQGDPMLLAYDTLIIDEAHERSLNIDFLMAAIRRIQSKRSDLRLIITSATIDPQRFAEHFSHRGEPAPIVEVAGRTYPVDLRYRPVEPTESNPEGDPGRALLDAVDEVFHEGPGDVLVFVATERDVREVSKMLRGRYEKARSNRVEILPLYARLTGTEQNRVFRGHPGRRIVVATNVAESSITVPGIRYVVDTGLARVSRFSSRARVQRLPIEPVSRASADQRKGRCGRVGPGVCIRLYDEEDYAGRDAFTPPEMLRTNLAAVILRSMGLGLGALERLPLLEQPRPSRVNDGRKTLYELGAIDDHGTLTKIGRQLARMPVDPRVARMVLAAESENVLSEVLVIASALEVADPRERPAEQQGEADAAHERFSDERSDFMAYLELWDFYHDLKGKLSRNQLRKACAQNFLSATRMREWTEVHRQLREVAIECGLKPRARREDFDAIHRSLLTGLLSGIAYLKDEREYIGSGQQKLVIWPGSGLARRKPKWIMAAERVETSRRFARTVAQIDPGWIEPIAENLIKRSYREPLWDRAAGTVMAEEKVTLFGLPVVPKRRVRYGRVDPKTSRRLFIAHALVDGDVDLEDEAYAANRALIGEIESLEAKLRRRGLMAEREAIYDYYDRTLPAGVFDVVTLREWLKRERSRNANAMRMSRKDVLKEDAAWVTPEAFPDEIHFGKITLPLVYRLEPGDERDGVTVEVPREAVGQLDAHRVDWLVQGLLPEKLEGVIRNLPKEARRRLVPAPEVARKAAGMMRFGMGSLAESAARAFSEIAEVPVEAAWIDMVRVDDHLRMAIEVLDAERHSLMVSRDLGAVRRKIGLDLDSEILPDGDSPWPRVGITRWDFEDLPESVEVRRGGMTLRAFPVLRDEGQGVALRLVQDPDQANRETMRGLVRLIGLQVESGLRHRLRHDLRMEGLRLDYAPLGDARTLERAMMDRIVERAYLDEGVVIRHRGVYEAKLDRGWNRIEGVTSDVLSRVEAILSTWRAAQGAAERVRSRSRQVASDLAGQIGFLIYPGFLARTPWAWLAQFPRYLRAIELRVEKLERGEASRDRKQMAVFASRWNRYAKRAGEHRAAGISDPQLEHMRWMLEEWRVMLFAQELGTAVSVSERKLDEQWARVRG
ncbi:ATP-dependent RNA helicase HrpA [Mucisphaera calidilacus]|uniref:ATP-dependent RNA helicase HrpA n=1 Tax=Mucisphaera calidilacus TaxID=2527982 RepID=UPI001F15C0DF|nr:ATP-dependent RNA helicase HrpA [Mucisphaera calidilacus]